MKLKCECGEVVMRRQNSFHCDHCNCDLSVGDVDVEGIRKLCSAGVESLTASMDWDQGLALSRDLETLTHRLCPPLLESHCLHIAVWKAIWIICGNKKMSKLF